jgi:hypothetical protein
VERAGTDSGRTRQRDRDLILKAQSWQDWCALFFNCIEAAGIESQRLKDSRSYLGGFDESSNCARIEIRIRKQHDYISIVVSKSAAPLVFCCFPCRLPQRSARR